MKNLSFGRVLPAAFLCFLVILGIAPAEAQEIANGRQTKFYLIK
jgi:hypothetical protein